MGKKKIQELTDGQEWHFPFVDSIFALDDPENRKCGMIPPSLAPLFRAELYLEGVPPLYAPNSAWLPFLPGEE